jgi:hypothetical protein
MGGLMVRDEECQNCKYYRYTCKTAKGIKIYRCINPLSPHNGDVLLNNHFACGDFEIKENTKL